ncbi:MAG TPA: TetR/AcrR family transcriptional regulator [Candidatus Methylacidiphilales bacterium]|nr:TetR/AcrR family transcriptional regulator [Candidatus Methylacidiphilales bacterium]
MKANPRPYHHGNLREALLRAAEAGLEARGAGSLSLRELARELGVSHTSPRRHFADKQALIDALAVSGFERLGASLTEAAAAKTRGFEDRLTRLAVAFVDFALRHPALWVLMLDAKHRPGAPAELLEASGAAFGHLHGIMREGQAAGRIIAGDTARLSLPLSAALLGLISISVKGKFKNLPLQELVPELTSRILLGLKPRKK